MSKAPAGDLGSKQRASRRDRGAMVSLMQARRRHLPEQAQPVNVDRRKAFMDILERLALGVTAVGWSEPCARPQGEAPQRPNKRRTPRPH
jgi:hypothetical protein